MKVGDLVKHNAAAREEWGASYPWPVLGMIVQEYAPARGQYGNLVDVLWDDGTVEGEYTGEIEVVDE